MNNLNWLLRAVKWTRKPPSPARIRRLVAVLLVAFVIFMLEWLGLWPDWAQMDTGGMRPRIPH